MGRYNFVAGNTYRHAVWLSQGSLGENDPTQGNMTGRMMSLHTISYAPDS